MSKTIVKKNLADQLNGGRNLQEYPHPSELPGPDILTLSQEVLSIDSERCLWSKLQTDYGEQFPALPHLSKYNRPRKHLAGSAEQLAQLGDGRLAHRKIPIWSIRFPFRWLIITRGHFTTVCRKHFDQTPDKDDSAITDQYYIGYELYLVVSLNGVYQCVDLTKVSVHDSCYLQDTKSRKLDNCLLLDDQGYLSGEQQIDLFYSTGIELQTLMRRNQQGYRPWSKVFKTSRRRIGIIFSQLCDHMILKRNYAKTFAVLRPRIISKVASTILLQCSWLNDKPINQIKHALAA